ncbi:MAG TPA: PP0621 family protein [Trinickia sp.]|jgi:uncharacterized protein|nr:PP0621 family protein [Trinickia sp.]HTI16921.1 PP0621 family protein [Trinickia sp.]
MRQLLLLILLIFAGRWLIKAIRAAEAGHSPRATAATSDGARTSAAAGARSLAEPVVRCVACGVHAPKSESLFSEGRYFCCAEHARRHAARAAGDR